MWTSPRAPRPWRRRLFTTVALLALLVPALAALAAYPVVDVNTGLTINEGAMATKITSSMLHVSMQNTPAGSIHYQLTSAPARGALKLDGVPTPLIAGNSFTQDDIDNGRLAYTHDGSAATSDSFDFRAADALRQPMTRVSVASDGTQGNGTSFGNRALSADGRFVAFYSYASTLVSGDTNNALDVFVANRQKGRVERVSVASGGAQGNGNSSYPAFSADGRFVAFNSDATNLVPGDSNSEQDVFVAEWQTGQIKRVSVASGGTQSNGGSWYPALSADGRFVAFESLASNLVSGDTNGVNDVFVHDRDVDGNGIFDEPGGIQTVRVSVASGGAQGNNGSSTPTFSADGRFVAFVSAATNLVSSDTNNTYDVFVAEWQTGQIKRVSVASSGTQGNNRSLRPALSADGRFVAFDSLASNLVSGDTNGVNDVFVHDRDVDGNGIFDQPGGIRTVRVSVASGGAQGNGDSYEPSISADGRFVAFDSTASTLIIDDINGSQDVFVHDWQTGQTTLVSVASNRTQGNNGSFTPALSADGRFVAFEAAATNLVSGDTNGTDDVFVADRGIAQRFAIGVNPINDPPTLSYFADQTVLSGGTITIPFQVGDEETPAGNLTLTRSSNNPALVPNDRLLLGGAVPNLLLAVQPLAGQTGQATITLSVSDGNQTTVHSFILTVQPSTPAPPWLALLYLAGDDIAPDGTGQTGLTLPLRDLLARLNAMPANPALRLVVLFDGDRSGDSELYVREPGAQGLTPVPSPNPWPKFSSELDSGSAATLRNFVTWARATYPGSPHTLLSIVDHGGGWAPDPGAFGQPRGAGMAKAGGWTGLALDAQANTSLSTKATGGALAGLGRFDVLFLDACLMGMIETATEVQPYADYLVAGENLLWSRLPYEHYLAPSVLAPTTAPRTLAQAIVQHYNEPPPTDEPFTIAALDLTRLPELQGPVNALAQHLLTALNQMSTAEQAEAHIRAAYRDAQKFDYDSSFSLDQTTDAYVDLADLATQLLRPENFISSEVTQAATQVRDEIVGSAGAPGVVVGNPNAVSGTYYATPTKPAWSFAGAHGLSIYLPLGERDCRPTGRPISDVAFAVLAPCVAPTTAKVGDLQIEPQLSYYVRPEQLRFSSAQQEGWVALLARLDAATPNRAAERPPIQSPFPATSRWPVYLPLVRR